MRAPIFFIFLLFISCQSSKQSSSNSSGAGASVEPKAAETKPMEEAKVAESQNEESTVWSRYSPSDIPDLEKRINPDKFVLWKCDYAKLSEQLSQEVLEIDLPTLAGLKTFSLTPSGTMNPELAEKFPNIRSFKGQSKDGGIKVRVDTNDEGLFVEYNTPGTEPSYASPYLKGSTAYYAVYSKSDLSNPGRDGSYK